MGKITFILGGARSGKSSFAVKLAAQDGRNSAFIATCEPLDEEMRKRIELHKQKRPRRWQTFEAPYDIPAALRKIKAKFGIVILDCLTLLISNLMLKGKKNDAEIEKEIYKIISLLKQAKSDSIIISNEVGLGIVPQNKLGRKFRDIAGRINQQVTLSADEVILMVSGIPLTLKKE